MSMRNFYSQMISSDRQADVLQAPQEIFGIHIREVRDELASLDHSMTKYSLGEFCLYTDIYTNAFPIITSRLYDPTIFIIKNIINKLRISFPFAISKASILFYKNNTFLSKI